MKMKQASDTKQKVSLLTQCLICLFIMVIIGAILFSGTGCKDEQKKGASDISKPIREAPQETAKSSVNFYHYWDNSFEGIKKEFEAIEKDFNKSNTTYQLRITSLDHEAYKGNIQNFLKGGTQPGAFTYWAGGRTCRLVDNNLLTPIDAIWAELDLDKRFLTSVVNTASIYRGKRYFVPLTLHYLTIFYNKKIFADLNITIPKNWDDFLAVCQKIKKAGITPIGLAANSRWTPQFWFDYLLLRTAGHEYRQKLMKGYASFTDKEVLKTFEIWKSLFDKGYFNSNSLDYNWDDIPELMYQDKVAMYLIGTFVGGQFKKYNWEGGKDYDFFTFPIINPAVPRVSVVTFDGLIVSNKVDNMEGTKALIDYMSSANSQARICRAAKSLSPHKTLPPNIYDPFMQRVSDAVQNASYLEIGYASATFTPNTIGHDCWNRFIQNPEKYMEILEETERKIRKALKNE